MQERLGHKSLMCCRHSLCDDVDMLVCLHISNLGTARGPGDFHHENVAPCRRQLSHFFGRILPLSCQNSATFVAEFCHFSARILPLLWQNSATFVPEFCHFCGRFLPLLCHNCATLGAESCRLGGHFKSRWLSGRAHGA